MHHEMTGRLWEEYIFDPITNQVILMIPSQYKNNIFHIDMRKILMITNITDNIIIYQPQIEGKGGSFSYPTLTLEYDCSSMDKLDELQILVELNFADLISMRSVAEARNQQTQVGILKTLLKIEKQLEIITDEQVKEDDISGPGLKRK